jgi:hypothetical protein
MAVSKKGIGGAVVLIGGAIIALIAISRWRASASTTSPTGPTNDLPGYTFPEPNVQGVVTDATGAVVAENYVVGTAQAAYDNAEAIKAAALASLPHLITSYNDVRQYDRNIGQIPAGYGGEMVNYDFVKDGQYLDITPYGWVVYAQDYSTLNPLGWANKRGSSSFGGLTSELPKWF